MMKRMMHAWQRFFSQVWLSYKMRQGAFDWAEFLALHIGYSLLSLILYCLIARFTTGNMDLTRWVVGNAFNLCLMECMHMTGTVFTGFRWNGTLGNIVAAPGNKLALVLQSGVSSILMAFIVVAAAMLFGGLIFSVPFSNLHIPAFFLCMLAATFACAGAGMLLSVFSLCTDSMYMLLNVATAMTIFFSGANFPVSQLPVWAQWIGCIFPLQRAIAAANLCFDASAGLPHAFYRLWGGELLLGLAFYIAAFLLLRFFERLARRKASLEIF